MAKGGHRRPVKRKKTVKKDLNESRNQQRVKDREKKSRKSKVLIRQMRGMKWDEEEYGEEFEEELDDIK